MDTGIQSYCKQTAKLPETSRRVLRDFLALSCMQILRKERERRRGRRAVGGADADK